MTETKKQPVNNQPKKRMRSVEASQAIWQTQAELTRSERFLLQALASHADELLECYPSTGRLAAMTKLSKRQVIRLLHGLRERGHLAFEENHGGRRKCNHYRLLIAANGDKKSDINGDIAKGDTLNKGDISNSERVTSCTETVTNSHVNSDTVMSPEWVEKFLEGVRTEGGEELTPPRLENDDITLDDDLFDDPEQFLKTVLAEGLPVIRDEVCHKHGPFARRGWIWRNWLIWKGSDPGYGNRYSKDAGCCGCEVEDAETKSVLVARNPDFIEDILVREFKLRGAMICDTHGAFVFKADLSERSMEYQQRFGRRYEVWGEGCPICDYDFHDEIDVSRCLDLSVDEWSRGGEAIMAALHYARGWMDSHVYVEALQHTVIPHVREWQEEHPVVEEPRLPNSLVEA